MDSVNKMGKADKTEEAEVVGELVTIKADRIIGERAAMITGQMNRSSPKSGDEMRRTTRAVTRMSWRAMMRAISTRIWSKEKMTLEIWLLGAWRRLSRRSELSWRQAYCSTSSVTLPEFPSCPRSRRTCIGLDPWHRMNLYHASDAYKIALNLGYLYQNCDRNRKSYTVYYAMGSKLFPTTGYSTSMN